MQRIYVSTVRYERSHLKKPRGSGAWAFTFARDGKELGMHIIGATSYTFALMKARIAAREVGADTIFVEP